MAALSTVSPFAANPFPQGASSLLRYPKVITCQPCPTSFEVLNLCPAPVRGTLTQKRRNVGCSMTQLFETHRLPVDWSVPQPCDYNGLQELQGILRGAHEAGLQDVEKQLSQPRMDFYAAFHFGGRRDGREEYRGSR